MEPDGSPNQAGADEMIAKLPEKMKNLKDNIIECMKVMKRNRNDLLINAVT